MKDFPQYIKNLAGTKLVGNYTICIGDNGLPIPAGTGAGASAYVVQARDRQGTLFAAKILRLERVSSESFLTRFREEFDKQARAKHPNIIAVYEFDTVCAKDDDRCYDVPYYVMEYVDGNPIIEWAIARENAGSHLSLAEVSSLIAQILEALSWAHNLAPTPLYHLDLKPANILISAEGIPKVGDFGLALAAWPPQLVSGARLSGRIIDAMHPDFRAMLDTEIDTSRLRPAFDLFGLGYTLSTVRDYLSRRLDAFSQYILDAMLLRLRVADRNAVEKLEEKRSGGISDSRMDTDVPEYNSAQEALETISKLQNSKYHFVSIPELQIENPQIPPIRISGHTHVPTTKRLRRVIDTPAFQRLDWLKQLDQISYTYPGATHTRREHSLGAYYYMLRYLRRLLQDPYFVFHFSCADIEAAVLAGLLHDIGHYPMAHSVHESGQLKLRESHEAIGRRILTGEDPVVVSEDDQRELLGIIEHEWRVNPQKVADIIFGPKESGDTKPEQSDDTKAPTEATPSHTESVPETSASTYERRRLALLHSIIDGPLDVDKMHYLQCDSTHTGNPVGANFDAEQLIDSLCISEHYDELAITYKGISAVESFMYARYRMHIDVYWHHTVRCVRKMIARAMDRHIKADADSDSIRARRAGIQKLVTRSTDRDFLRLLLSEFESESEAGQLIRHLITPETADARITRPQRRLFKRLRTYYPDDRGLAKKIFSALTPGGPVSSENVLGYEAQIASDLSQMIRTKIQPWEIILDVPPNEEGKRMEDLQVRLPKAKSEFTFAWLSMASKVAEAIAADFVSNSRVIQLLCSPRAAGTIPSDSSTTLDKCIFGAIETAMKAETS